jgi:hypothetical protein
MIRTSPASFCSHFLLSKNLIKLYLGNDLSPPGIGRTNTKAIGLALHCHAPSSTRFFGIHCSSLVAGVSRLRLSVKKDIASRSKKKDD